jgi:cysteine synthase A
VYERVSDIVHDKVFLKIKHLGLSNFYLKLEATNPAGSVKLKTALGLIEDLEARGLIKEDTILIESSSGNLGVALSMISAERGLNFTCVVDPNTSAHNIKIMKAFGANVVLVNKHDANGGYLGTRIAYVREAIERDKRFIWLNQYENPNNPLVHARMTARSIAESFERLDYLFVGAGTTGTLMGCVQYFRKHRPETKIIAVDSVGSVTFGKPPGKRYIPGLGSSQRPPIFDPTGIFSLEVIPEADAVAMCRHLARTNGLLAGGSTGTVVAGVYAWRDRLPEDAVVVAISPDFGERYLDTVYDDDWAGRHFGENSLTKRIAHIQSNPAPASPKPEAPAATPGRRFHIVSGKAAQAILSEAPEKSIASVEAAYLAHHDRKTVNPDSYFLRFPDKPANRIIALPATIGGNINVSGIKWIASFPENIKAGIARASATLVLNDTETGYPFACLEASQISAARTAASAVLAARWMNGHRREAPAITFVGAGVIARNIFDMFVADKWTFENIYIHDLDRPSAEAFRQHAAEKTAGTVFVQESRAEALRSNIVVFATNVGTPYVLPPEKFAPGQIVLHISLRDISPDLVLDAVNIVDDVDHCLKANTTLHLAEQKLGHRRFIAGTLAELMRGEIAVDRSRPLIFSPFGLGVLDLAVGKHVFDEACRRGMALAVPDFFPERTRW